MRLPRPAFPGRRPKPDLRPASVRRAPLLLPDRARHRGSPRSESRRWPVLCIRRPPTQTVHRSMAARNPPADRLIRQNSDFDQQVIVARRQIRRGRQNRFFVFRFADRQRLLPDPGIHTSPVSMSFPRCCTMTIGNGNSAGNPESKSAMLSGRRGSANDNNFKGHLNLTFR